MDETKTKKISFLSLWRITWIFALQKNQPAPFSEYSYPSIWARSHNLRNSTCKEFWHWNCEFTDIGVRNPYIDKDTYIEGNPKVVDIRDMGPILERPLNNIYIMIQYSYIGWVGPVPRATVAKTPFPRERPMVSVFYLVSVNPMASNGIQWYQSLNHFQRHDGPGLLRLKLDLSDSLIRMCFAFNSSNLGQQLATKYWSHWHTRTHREEARLFEGFDPPDRHRHKTHHNEVLSQHHRCEQHSRSPQSIGRCACPPWQPHQSRFATQCQCR